MLDLLTFGARVKGTFLAASEEADVLPWIRAISWETDSDSATETYASLGSAPRMTQWGDGPRPVEDSIEQSFVVPNNDWANAVKISAKDFRRQKFGEFDRLVGDLAVAGRTHPNELALSRIQDFETTITAYDGQLYFDTDHLSGISGVQSNDLDFPAVTGAVPTIAEIRDAISAAVIAQRGYLNDKARPYMQGSGGSYLVLCPTNQLAKFSTALYSDTLQGTGGAIDNSLRQLRGTTFELVDDATLDATWGTTLVQFALFRIDGPGNALVIQEEVPLTPDGDGINAYELFTNKRLLFGAQRAYNLLGLHWHKAVLTSFSTI